MELHEIVARYAECLEKVDSNTPVIATKRNQGRVFYQPGIQPMTEEVVVPLLDLQWTQSNVGELTTHLTQVHYPTQPSRRRGPKIDHVLSHKNFVAAPGETPYEWGIEVKRLQFVGDNGNRGDYEVTKVLSPYLKDRGMLHDALRLRDRDYDKFTKRVGIIGFGFDYDVASLTHASTLHSSPQAIATLKNIRSLVGANGPLYHRPLIEFADSILRLRGWTVGPRAEARFQAWKHPSGGRGIVFGWEIRREWLEAGYDKRHQW